MRVLIALSLTALALAGCTGGGGDNGGDTFVTPPQDAEGRYIIEVGGDQGQKFSPAHAEVPVGATVIWINMGGVHNVVADDGSFDSGAADSGDWNYTHTFDAAGDFPYVCEPHATLGMEGTIRVA